MEQIKNSNKVERVLGIYTRLVKGKAIKKSEEAKRYGVDERTIQRDINDIRTFFENAATESGEQNTVEYDYTTKRYHLSQIYRMQLSNPQVLAVCKILLDSRAFTKEEMTDMLEKLISCCVPKQEQKLIRELIRNEEFHYVEPRHKTKYIDTMWSVAQAIQSCSYIEVEYQRSSDHKVVTRKLKPVAILFSEYYFYLTAFIDGKDVLKTFDVKNDPFPTIYRMDRIKKLRILDEKFHIPYSSRFEEGEFRKRVQFMYGGKLQRIKFLYKGNDIEAILDRLPTAKVLSEEDGVYTVFAEVFGNGIDMWIRSQGEAVEVLERR